MQPTITPPKTFKLKTHLVFTTIEIEKRFTLLRKHYFLATFKSGDSEENLKEQELTGSNIDVLLKRISWFLDCQIDERHYIIK